MMAEKRKCTWFFSLELMLALLLCSLFITTAQAAAPELNKTALTMSAGSSFRLKLLNNRKTIEWTSSESDVVSVDQSGMLTANQKGDATVTAKAGGKKYNCKVTVTDGSALKGRLTLQVKVTSKGKPVRVNKTFYLTLFADKKLTQKLYKKAFQLKNASSKSATLVVNLFKMPDEKVTFYIAETDRKGVPLKSGKAFGYRITVDGSSKNLAVAALGPGNLKQTVTVVNDKL